MSANAGRSDLDHLLRAAHVPTKEPIFYLRARDPSSFAGVLAYARDALEKGVPIAVVEQALQQGDRLKAFGPKQIPDAGHLTEADRKQLEYRHSRRAWRGRDIVPVDPVPIILAERRGWDAAMARVRAQGGETAAEIVGDAIEILDVLIADREAMIGGECEVARDLLARCQAFIEKTQARDAA